MAKLTYTLLDPVARKQYTRLDFEDWVRVNVRTGECEGFYGRHAAGEEATESVPCLCTLSGSDYTVVKNKIVQAFIDQESVPALSGTF